MNLSSIFIESSSLIQSGGDASAVDAAEVGHPNDRSGGMPKEDTLQYLSQLESVARRLKDQLLMEQPKVSSKTQVAQSRKLHSAPDKWSTFGTSNN